MDDRNIVLVGDRALPRRGLRTILEGEYGLSVIGEADDLAVLPGMVERLKPHLVILDGSVADLMPETVSGIKAKHPGAKVLILVTLDEKEYLHRSLRCGADGYFLKEDTAEELLSAVEKLLQDQMYVSPRLSVALVDIVRGNRKSAETPLTVREKEVLRLLAEGMSSKEIAGALSISVYTVERHRANLMRKLKVRKNTELVRYAINHDII